MKNLKYLSVLFVCSGFSLLCADAEWTFLTYIQADNNLWNYAYYNINDMQLGTLNTAKVNVLVQWDQPGNNRTWRYKIVNGGRIEDASLTTEMGTNPSKEIVDCASWIKSKYPAKKYAWVLWNHGMGVEDRAVKTADGLDRFKYSWLELPGYNKTNRGILYDDSQATYLSTQSINSTFAQVSTILGQKLSVLGMDACLMAMIEIGYQVKDYAEVFVASQQTEPGDGWSYSPILNALTSSPESISAITLGQAAVAAYDRLYKQSGETDYTQSAMNLSDLSAVKTNIDDLYAKVTACKIYKSAAVKSAIISARKKTLSFYISDYIDLYNFYNNFLAQVQILKSQKSVTEDDVRTFRGKPLPRPRPKPIVKPKPKPNTTTTTTTTQSYTTALAALETTLKNGLKLITAAVKANAVGSADKNAKGISIYYPSSKSSIAATYRNTVFAQQSKWLAFITENR